MKTKKCVKTLRQEIKEIKELKEMNRAADADYNTKELLKQIECHLSCFITTYMPTLGQLNAWIDDLRQTVRIFEERSRELEKVILTEVDKCHIDCNINRDDNLHIHNEIKKINANLESLVKLVTGMYSHMNKRKRNV